MLSGCGRAVTDPHQGLHLHDTGLEVIARTEARLTFRLFVPEDIPPLTCAVTAPSGASVDCAVSEWVPDTVIKRERSSTLSFTPHETGLHTVRATIDSDELLTSAYVIEAEGPELTTLDRPCTWLERFADGAWMCDRDFLREGELAQPLDVELTAVMGDLVWTFSNGRVELLREPVAGLQFGPPLGTIELNLGSARTLLASGADVFVIHANGVIRVAPDARGALVETGRIERAILQSAVVRRVGSSVVIADRIVPFVLGMNPTDPAQDRGDESMVCVLAVSESAITETGCRRYPGIALGESDDGVFLAGQRAELRAVTETLDDGLTLVLPLTFGGALTTTPRGRALFGPGAIVKKFDGALRLQSFSGASGANDRLVWSVWPTGTRVMSR